MKEEPLRLRQLLSGMGQRLGLPDPAATGMLWTRWREIVGPGIAAHCSPSSLKEGVLRLRADSPTWATEVGYLAGEIRRKANAAAGSELVREVKVWVDPGVAHGTEMPGPKTRSEPARDKPKRDPDGDPVEALGRAREAWARARSRPAPRGRGEGLKNEENRR